MDGSRSKSPVPSLLQTRPRSMCSVNQHSSMVLIMLLLAMRRRRLTGKAEPRYSAHSLQMPCSTSTW